MGHVNRKWYDNSKSFAVIVTRIPKSQMGKIWSICDYSVKYILKSEMVLSDPFAIIVSEYTLIANIPISQMYQNFKCTISYCYFYQVIFLPINCVLK